MPVVRRGDDHSVDPWIIQDPSKVCNHARSRIGDVLHSIGQQPGPGRIRITDGQNASAPAAQRTAVASFVPCPPAPMIPTATSVSGVGVSCLGVGRGLGVAVGVARTAPGTGGSVHPANTPRAIDPARKRRRPMSMPPVATSPTVGLWSSLCPPIGPCRWAACRRRRRVSPRCPEYVRHMTARLAHLGAAVTVGAASLALVVPTADVPAPVPTVSPATQAGSPWPTMRHDLRNTGASDLVGTDPGIAPWSFTTDVGIFSTPVVSADGTIYVGSADNVLHGLDRTGKEVWSFTTGGIIDTAPALLASEPGIGESLVLGAGRRDPAAGPDRSGRAGVRARRLGAEGAATGRGQHPAGVLVGGQPERRTGRHHLPGEHRQPVVRHHPGRTGQVGDRGRQRRVDGARRRRAEHHLLGIGRCPDLRPRRRR